MRALAEQQQALLAALFEVSEQSAAKKIADYAIDTGARGLKAYRNNAHALAQRALCAVYPVLAQLLGEESFASLARVFWHARPLKQGDVSQWGAELAEFMEASDQLRDEPYLPDVARLEWAMHVCASAADGFSEAASLQLLVHEDPKELTMTLAPGIVMVRSAWPVVSIVQAHMYGEPDFETVTQRLSKKEAETALVWRDNFRPRFRHAMPGETNFLGALQQHKSLAAAIDQAELLDFTSWLPMAVQSSLLLGVHQMARQVKRSGQ